MPTTENKDLVFVKPTGNDEMTDELLELIDAAYADGEGTLLLSVLSKKLEKAGLLVCRVSTLESISEINLGLITQRGRLQEFLSSFVSQFVCWDIMSYEEQSDAVKHFLERAMQLEKGE
jgi:sorbitol-specific phosphotransferase system component IIBC